MTSVRRLAVPTALACAAVLVPATAALAEEPQRTGWWNRASAGPLVAPAPTTEPGQLRVASGPDAPSAYAAVLYPTAGSTSATLDLKVAPGSTLGTPEVVACPTVTTDWPEGDNQPYSAAPEFDCEAGSAFGSLSEDGSTISFLLDSSTQTEPGVWSLALVPQPDSTSGLFAIDFEKPDAAAFMAAPADGSTDAGSGFEPQPFDPGTTGGDSSGSGSSGDAFFPSFEAPPSFDTGGTGTAEVAPLVAGGDEAALPEPTAPEPAVAGQAPANPPVLLARPAGVVEDVGTGRRLLGLLVLAGGSAAVGYAAGQQRPAPRLIGGRARALPAAAAATPVPAAPVEERPRGIGRFARVRDAAPRRLR